MIPHLQFAVIAALAICHSHSSQLFRTPVQILIRAGIFPVFLYKRIICLYVKMSGYSLGDIHARVGGFAGRFQTYRRSDPGTVGGALWSRFKDHLIPFGPGRDIPVKVAAYRNKDYFPELSRRLQSGQRVRAVSYQDGTMRFSSADRDGLYGRAPRKVAPLGAPRLSSHALRSVRNTRRRMQALSRSRLLSRFRAQMAAVIPRRFRVPRPMYPRRRRPRTVANWYFSRRR